MPHSLPLTHLELLTSSGFPDIRTQYMKLGSYSFPEHEVYIRIYSIYNATSFCTNYYYCIIRNTIRALSKKRIEAFLSI